MAYAPKYVFRFQSQNGEEFQIIIEKDGYSGATINRCLGKSPVLKRERNGHVCGSSLEIYAECQTDGEFAEFYTSDPKKFRVSLVSATNSRVLFRGFISPELYSEPDIAPPYDVQIIATDGLGELRRYLYEPLGDVSLSILLEYLLEKTGLPGYFYHNNDTLTAGGSSTVPAADFFDKAHINLDYMVGKSCYDVLTALLDSVHADLFQSLNSGQTNYWQIIREVDVESGASVVVKRSPSGAYDETVVPQGFGSMQNYGWWPVGQMETQVKPACKRLTVISDAQYKDGLVNGAMTSDTGWTKTNASYSSSLGAYQITSQNGKIAQTLSFVDSVRRRLKLVINLRQYRPTSSAASTAGTASIRITAALRNYGGTGTRYLLKNSNDEYYWSTTSGSLSVDLPAPAYNEGADACTVFEVEIPLYYTSSRNYAMASQLTVEVIRDSSNIPLLVHSAALTFEEQIAGYRDVFTIDNGARDEADDVTSVFMPSGSGYYNTPAEFMYGTLRDYNWAIMSVFDQVGADYAKSCVLPRLLKKGNLNVPAGSQMPFVMRDSNGDNYLVQTAEWDLLNCEMSVEILSLPASSVTISGQAISEVTYKGGTATSGGSSSSGGGGGGGGAGVTSVGLEMPTGFSVSGSPVTESGTIQVSLDNTRVIPTTTEQTAWNAAAAAAHSHSNKTTLDRIAPRDVNFLKSVEYFMLHAAPTVKRFTVQANYEGVLAHEYPFFIVRHPLFDMGITEAEVCLMVYRKRNGNGGSDKAHRKGWFLACGAGHAINTAYAVAATVVENGSVTVPELFLKDGIARTYCQHDNVSVLPVDYSDWIFQVANATAFGFAGSHEATMLKHKIHFGLAVRLVNPEFEGVVDPLHELDPDTNCIQGIPRYLYSAVAPLTAHMYTRTVGGQQKGSIVFDLL